MWKRDLSGDFKIFRKRVLNVPHNIENNKFDEAKKKEIKSWPTAWKNLYFNNKTVKKKKGGEIKKKKRIKVTSWV